MRHYHILEAVGGMHAYWQLRERLGVFFSAEDAVEAFAQAYNLSLCERERLRRYWHVDVFYPEPEGWDRLARVPSGFPLLVRRLPISPPWWRRLFDRGPRLGMSRLVIMSCDRATCTEDGGGAPVSPVK